MKRTIVDLGKAITAEDLRVSVKRAWKKMAPMVCKKIGERVLRNMAIAKVDGRNFYGESMTKKYARSVNSFSVLRGKTSTGYS